MESSVSDLMKRLRLQYLQHGLNSHTPNLVEQISTELCIAHLNGMREALGECRNDLAHLDHHKDSL